MPSHHSTATTGGRIVICINFELIPVNKVNVWFPFPRVGHLGDRDQLYGLTLQTKKKNIEHMTLTQNWALIISNVQSKQNLLYYVKISWIPVVECVTSGSTCSGVPWQSAAQHSPLQGLGSPLLGISAQGDQYEQVLNHHHCLNYIQVLVDRSRWITNILVFNLLWGI